MDGPGFEFQQGIFLFPKTARPTLGSTKPPTRWEPGVLSREQGCRGVTTAPHPPSILSRLGQEQIYRCLFFQTVDSHGIVTFVAEYRSLQSLGLC